jgi:anti-sigma B factor antagonist
VRHSVPAAVHFRAPRQRTVAQPASTPSPGSGAVRSPGDRPSCGDRVAVGADPDEGPCLLVWSVDADEACTVTVRGEVDCLTAPEFRQVLLDVLSRPQPPPGVVVDLRGVTFLGAAGLTVLAFAHRLAESAGQVLRVRCGTARAAIRPLQITGLWNVLDIVERGPGRDRC